jgi:hypothetical protein
MNSLYNAGERVDIARPPTDAYLVLDSADRASSSSSTGITSFVPITQPYNDFRLQKPENLVQGGFTRLQLTEARMPYAIPNVNARNNSFWVVVRTSTGDLAAQIALPAQPVSLGGDTIATSVAALLNASTVIGTAALGIAWTAIYYPESPGGLGYQAGGFSIGFTTTATVLDFALFPVRPLLNYPNAPVPSTSVNTKSLLDVMGYQAMSNWSYLTSLSNTVVGLVNTKDSAYAPLSYTKYIDIVSSKLTYYANVKDGSTKTGSAASVICRLYISDETSASPIIGQYYTGASAVSYLATPPAGSVPFVIHRQFAEPKQFRWDKDTAVDYIDIQLLDDAGQPLYVPPEGLPDFQLTFKCTED